METTLLLALALGGLIGVALGMFGGGGSILAVPALVYAAHVAPAVATGMSLAIVGTISLIASYSHHRRGHVRGRVALFFGSAGVVAAYLGARLTHLVSGRTLMLSFAALMLTVGVIMLVKKTREECSAEPGTREVHMARATLAGAAIGALTGFLGVGGGFLVVPALVAFAGLGMREAIGTSLLVIATNSAAGLAGHLDTMQLDVPLVVMFTVAGVLGATGGARLARHIAVGRLRRGFAVFVILIAVAATMASLAGSPG